jgi:hypothetical protein
MTAHDSNKYRSALFPSPRAYVFDSPSYSATEFVLPFMDDSHGESVNGDVAASQFGRSLASVRCSFAMPRHLS